MTPVLPSVGGSVGRNGEGNPTALTFDLSTMEARASLRPVRPTPMRSRRVLALPGSVVFRSTPFVSLFAAQLTSQLTSSVSEHSSADRPGLTKTVDP